MEITFTNPYYLWMLLLIPFFFVTHFYSFIFVKKRALRLANFEALERISGKRKVSFNWLILLMRSAVLASLVCALSGMTIWYEGTSADQDFVLTLDASGSMLANDFKPNRLEAAKEAAILFIDSIDAKANVAVVSFSGLGEVELQLSSDVAMIKQAIRDIAFKSIHGTAIGDAIKVSMNVVAGSTKPRTIILLTDGRENVVSKRELLEIADAARKNQIIIHTIGIGTEEGGMVPGLDVTSTIDDSLLGEIAERTKGSYSRVRDKNELVGKFQTIAQTSQGNIPIDMNYILLLAAILLIFVEWGLINTKFKTIP